MKKYAAAVMLSALLLTACGTETGGTEQSQTVSASEETTLTAETEETISSVSRTKEEEEEYSRMMGTANCVVTHEVISVEGYPTLGYYTTAARTENVPEGIALNENAEFCLSKLDFGMSMSEAESAVDAKINEEMLNPFYSVYDNISVDIDNRFDGAMLSYGESGLDEVTLYAYPLTEDECTDLRDKIINFFSTAYGFSYDEWEIKENSDYCKKDGVSVYTRVYLSDGSYSVNLLLTSWNHRNFKDCENQPILP